MTLIFNRIRGKITLLALLLLCAVGVWGAAIGGKTIYLQAGDWSQAGAWFQIYYWGSSGNGWLTMENVTCDIYKATIPSGNYNGMKFCRTQPGKPARDWNYVWNQTGDLSPAAEENKYDVTWTGGTWYPHTVLPKDTYIYFDNSQTQWSQVWMSEVCGCCNKDRNVDNYVPKEDCYWYKMEQYCGSIYRVKLAKDAYYNSLSFFASDQRDNNNVYATSTVLHVGLDADNPMVIPCDYTWNSSRETNVWSCSIKSPPGPKIETGTRIYYNNSKTQWDDVYMSETYGCNVYRGIDEYSPKEDANWYKMKKYCGDVYYVDLTAPACNGLFSFFNDEQKNSDGSHYDDVYAADCLLHYGYNSSYPVFNPYIRSGYNESREGYEWSGDLKALPSIIGAPLSTIELSTTKTNPVHRGTTVTLETSDLSQDWTWYQSTSGTSFVGPISGTSGAKNQTLTVTPEVSTYYRIKDPLNICSATYRIEIDIACNGEKMTLLDLNFDEDESNTEFTTYQQRRPVAANKGESVNTKIYSYTPEGKEILDGFYAILANPFYGGYGMQATCYDASCDCYPPDCQPSDCNSSARIECLKNVKTEAQEPNGHYWYSDIKDHTHGGASDGHIGGMLMANCKEKGEVIFRKEVEMCGHNLFMTFSAYFANATSAALDPKEIIPINAQIRIMNEDETEEVAHIDVMNVKPNAVHSSAWKQGTSSFFSGKNDKLVIQIINYGESGTGNDILIDDIKFTACVPTVTPKIPTVVYCGSTVQLEVDPNGIAEVFGGDAPYYLWQRWDFKNEIWVSIPEGGSGCVNCSGDGKNTYNYGWEHIDDVPEGEKPTFRVIMANEPDVANKVAAGNPPKCVNYAITENIKVECECNPITIARKTDSGDDEQIVCEGNDIDPVVYYIEQGEYVETIEVENLPDGLVIATSSGVGGLTATISGTLPVTGSDQDYTIKVYAVGPRFLSCQSNELELVIHAKEMPSLTLVKGDGMGADEQSICYGQASIDNITYLWGGSATGVDFTQNPTSTAAFAGLDHSVSDGDKTIVISGMPDRTTTYKVSTTGQDEVCSAIEMTGTITVKPTPVFTPTDVYLCSESQKGSSDSSTPYDKYYMSLPVKDDNNVTLKKWYIEYNKELPSTVTSAGAELPNTVTDKDYLKNLTFTNTADETYTVELNITPYASEEDGACPSAEPYIQNVHVFKQVSEPDVIIYEQQ